MSEKRRPQPRESTTREGIDGSDMGTGPTRSSNELTLVAGDGSGASVEGFEIVHSGRSGDEEAPPSPRQFGDIEQKVGTTTMKGSVEQVPDSAPHPGEFAALEHNDKPKMKGSIEQILDSAPCPGTFSTLAQDNRGKIKYPSTKCAPISPPIPDDLAAATHGDSLDLARIKQRQNRIIDSGPNENSRSRQGADSIRNPDRTNSPPRTLNPSGPSVREPPVRSNTITADVQAMSPYINDNDEIIIPEAIAVNPEDIPSATVVRPAKYSLTIAGRKFQFRFLALGAIIILGATTILSVTLTKRRMDPGPDSAYMDEILAYSPSSTPSSSPFPTSDPSTIPSNSPSSALQAELVDIILEYSSTVAPGAGDDTILPMVLPSDLSMMDAPDEENFSSLFSGVQQRAALNWLVDDQSAWREEKEALPNAEIAERYALALLYYETRGEEWFKPFEFLTKEHVCKWRGILFRTVRKGVTRCTNGGSGRVQSLMLADNNLRGTFPAEIGLLQELTELDFEVNDMQGNVPSTLGSLTNITHLKLNGNDFSGPIDSVAGLSNLKYLDLSSNDLTGSLIDTSNLTKLEIFKVNGNKLSGTVPKAFSNLPLLGIFLCKYENTLPFILWFYLSLTFFCNPLLAQKETLHLQWNQLYGNVDFLCKDLPSNYRFDCDGDKPEVSCPCCIGCTIVNDTVCDPETEKMIALDIYSGSYGNGFEWKLREEFSSIPIAAGGDMDDGQQLNIQLCLSYPGRYSITTSTATPPLQSSITSTTISPTVAPAQLSYRIDGVESRTMTPNDSEYFYVEGYPTTNPSAAPSVSFQPTSSGLPTTATSSPTELSADDDIWGPNSYAPRPPPQSSISCGQKAPLTPRPAKPLPCDGLLELTLTTDAFGMDTSWELFDRNYNTVVATKSNFASNQTLSFTECLDMRRCYDFVIKDAWDDGICCQQGKGSYNVSVDGRHVSSGGEFGSSETIFIGGSCGADVAGEWQPPPMPTLTPTTPRPPPSSTTDYSFCPGLTIELDLTTDAFGLDTSWELIDRNEDVAVVMEKDFPNSQSTMITECLDPRGCYDFVIKDARDNGICCQQGRGSYDISANGRLIGSGGEFGSSDTVFIGGNCGVNAAEGGACPKDLSLLNVTLFPSVCGSRYAKWEVVDVATGQTYGTNSESYIPNIPASSVKCIPQKDCYQLEIYDSDGAEWLVEYDGDLINSGSGQSNSTRFGPQC
mmetsp:Transcript_25138/g.52562  ORF Transcript_25138/g.52562 Transcript_25138/m.52562 type:complete len:1211 (-) Transcript_25138:78-3710(-)